MSGAAGAPHTTDDGRLAGRGAVTRRVPVVATLVVAAAIATMIALGVWQLQRRAEKLELLETFAARATEQRVIAWPRRADDEGAALYRKAALTCVDANNPRAVAQTAGRGRCFKAS